MAKSNGKTIAKANGKEIVRTSQGLRDVLMDELQALCDGRTTPTMANAKTKLVGEIVNTVQLELNVAKFVNRSHKTAPKFEALSLGVAA
jgi:hypothetical protein